MMTVISISFAIGLGLSAIAGLAVFAEAAMRLIGAAMAGLANALARWLTPVAERAGLVGEETSQPRARSI